MKRKDYHELINGYKQSLNRKEAVLQTKFLVLKKCYESAYLIVQTYGLNVGELLSYDLSQKDYDLFIDYLKEKDS